MTEKFYLKEVCGEYKFYEEGDSFPLTEKQILNKLKENEQLKEHQRTLEAKIVRLKDRVKTFEKHYSLKDIERYKKMDNCNCIDSRRLNE